MKAVELLCSICDSAAARREVRNWHNLFAAIEGVDGDLLILAEPLGKAASASNDRRHIIGFGDAAAHIDEQEREVLGRHFGVKNCLL